MKEIKEELDSLNKKIVFDETNPSSLQQLEGRVVNKIGKLINNHFLPSVQAKLGMFLPIGVSIGSMLFGVYTYKKAINALGDKLELVVDSLKQTYNVSKNIINTTVDKSKTAIALLNPFSNHDSNILTDYLQTNIMVKLQLLDLFNNNALYGDEWLWLILNNLDKIAYEKDPDKLITMCDSIRGIWVNLEMNV